MKKLVMVSNESVFAGVVKCGMAELVDTLANSLSTDYDVSIVCPDGNGLYARAGGIIKQFEDGVRSTRFSNVDYYMIDFRLWPTKAAEIIDKLKPDIFHNLAEPELLGKLSVRPKKAIYTFDNIDYISGNMDYVSAYDGVTTNSVSYASGIMRMRSNLSVGLMSTDFRGISSGILDAVFSPEKGLLLPAKYTSTNQYGKALCKRRLMETYGIKDDPCIYLTMCRLVKEKGIEEIISAIPTIKETGGMLVIVGKGDEIYEKQLSKFSRSDGVIYVDRWASPIQAAPMAAGSDFFLQPSLMEVGGLMPLTVSRYGAIPIVTLNGGLVDNFNEENAIIVYDDLSDAIHRSAELYSDKKALVSKRKVCMEQDFSWTTRKSGYIELYEK